MHSLYPKLHKDELLTSTPAQAEELKTSLSSPCKTIPFYCDVCVEVATKAQPSVMANIISDLT